MLKKFLKKKNTLFIQDNAYNVKFLFKKINFLFTQSAIEHFKYDLIF